MLYEIFSCIVCYVVFNGILCTLWFTVYHRFTDKTRNDWSERHNFVKYQGKYDLVAIDYNAQVCCSMSSSHSRCMLIGRQLTCQSFGPFNRDVEYGLSNSTNERLE